jgi:hypothetical protein
MRRIAATVLLIGVLVWSAPAALAQRRQSPEVEGLAYVYSAFLTQADPGVMAERVALGPELQRELQLPASAEGRRVYEALVARAGANPVDVRRSTAQEVAAYGARRGLDPGAGRPLYTLEAGSLRYLLQYDLAQLRIAFVGQLGGPDPDPPPARKKAKPEPKAKPEARR